MFVDQSPGEVRESSVGVWIDCEILHRKLLPSRPPYQCLMDLYALLIRERDGQREGFPLVVSASLPQSASQSRTRSTRCLVPGIDQRCT